jgi:hypothetical protein
MLVLLGSASGQAPADANPPQHVNHLKPAAGCAAREAVFDGEPQHPWNRLHRQFYSRTTQDSRVYDRESLEPFFVSGSKFLAEGPSHRQAVALLDAFLKEHSDAQIKDPLKRAILQRDLWAVFTTTVSNAEPVIGLDNARGRIISTGRFEDRGDATVPAEQRARRREVQKRLVEIIRRIALTPEEIDALPDNLAQAVKAGTRGKAFDPEHPTQAFLPPDLMDQDGSWVVVSNRTRANEEYLAAPDHVRFTKGRSFFVVLLRLPSGRQATEAFIKMTRDGDLPQLPEGTQTALLRRMILIDSSGSLRETPITESLQIRVYRKLDLGIPFEFTLQRCDLFAGRGGLRAVGADESSYFDFQTQGGDVFEMPKLPPAAVIMKTCHHCHERIEGRGGIDSVNTVYDGLKPTGLVSTTWNHEASTSIDWVRKSYSWGLLQGLWAARGGE